MITGAKLGMIAGKPNRQKAYLGYKSSTGSGTSYTATITDFGGILPSSSRIVVAEICSRQNSPVDTVTIAGVSATLYAKGVGAANMNNVCFAVAVVPTGTGNFDVVVNTSSAYTGIAVAAYCLDGLDSNTPYASNYAAGNSITVPTVPDISYTIVGVDCRSEVGTFSGTLGLTKDGGVKYYSDRSAAWGSVDSTSGGSNLTATYSGDYNSYEAINYITFK